MERIQICGGSGSGKTTLAGWLSPRLGLPLPTKFWRSLRRTVARGITGTPCCNGNAESLLRLHHRDGVMRYLLRRWRARRARYRQFATLAALRHVCIVHLTQPAEVAAFVAGVADELAPISNPRTLLP